MTDATEQQIEITLAPLRERVVTHPLYAHLRDERAIRIFMEAHVFAVWDFQSLLKALQRLVTCVEVPWLPTSDPEARRLLNEIVLDEESDQAPEGGYLSHFELYLRAMRECGANVVPIQTFLGSVTPEHRRTPFRRGVNPRALTMIGPTMDRWVALVVAIGEIRVAVATTAAEAISSRRWRRQAAPALPPRDSVYR